ncbi:hypothetical protein GPECTOR_7g1138 [Gonium pectorale]|uniref:BP28 C-terminal domain-containing protein n=1 Tax=Gonium pectorale TaxID=33097 RepID=A0A150GTY5_GONPE|nr:hypothetical protein GPECTOR_7g1138 [Gonium pectorale]|eukprot:KXZ53244.1 hypothetical protein GPECTOR_7g1138 [Gonium pectorale]
MATALASQLQALARQRQAALPAAVKKGKASLLFDFQKAADVDVQTIYDIACQGLDDLIRLEPRFRSYRDNLFSRGSVELNPDLQSAEFLAKVDERVQGFCRLLSNHFLTPAAFKALEYLIRRYKANERNVDALMVAALPYHATNEFVRLVQTLALGPAGSLWGWLAKMQSSGAALPRDLLARRCANERQLLLFICKTAGHLGSTNANAGSAAAAGGSGGTSQPANRTFLSFYAVLLCEVLAVTPELKEDFLSALLPHLLDGLGRSAGQDYRAATMMAVAELCSRTNLAREFVKVLLNGMIQHTEPVSEHIRTVLLVMAHLAVTQPHIKTLSEKTLKYLFALPNVVSELGSLAQRGNIRLGPLLALLARSLTSVVAASTGSEGPRGRSEADLLALAHAGLLKGAPAQLVASALLEAGGAPQVDAHVKASCRKLLKVLDQRYPETTDAAVNAFLEPIRNHRKAKGPDAAAGAKSKRRKTHHGASAASDSDSDDDGAAETVEAAAAGLTPEDRARFDFVCSTFASGGCFSAPCGGTMMTLTAALAAPQAAVRRMALQQLDSGLSSAAGAEGAEVASEARSALTAAALARLRDDDLSVVVAALGLSCLRQLSPTVLLDTLQPLVHRLGEFLYGAARLPQLKAARKAARKVASLVRHADLEAASVELREAAALQLSSLLLPSYRDPRVAVEAARATAALKLPVFSGLSGAASALDAHVKEAAGAADGDGDGKKSDKSKAKKAAQRAAAAAIERDVVAVLAKSLAADPAARAADVLRLVQASASSSSDGAAAAAAALRSQHVLLLASHAAVGSASSSGGPGSSRAAKQTAAAAAVVAELARSAIHLAEILLPYARFTDSASSAFDGGQQQWDAAFADQLSTEDGLPTESHAAAIQASAPAAHAALILGTLRANLLRLPAATEATADHATAERVLGQLSSLEVPAEKLLDLPLLVVTRRVPGPARGAFLARLYASPIKDANAPQAALRCLALHVQAQLVTESAAGSRSAHAVNVGGWFATLLPALASSESSVRAAAVDCLEVLGTLLEAGKASAGDRLSADVAAALCTSFVSQRKLLTRDAEAVVTLLRSALDVSGGGAPADAAVAASAPLPTPSKRRGSAKAAAEGHALSGAPPAAELIAYMTWCLRSLEADPVGINTAGVLLACLLPSAPEMPVVGPELFTAGAAMLHRINDSLHVLAAAGTTMALGAHVAQQLLRLYTPKAVAAAAAAGLADQLSQLAEAMDFQLRPSVGSAAAEPVPLAVSEALASIRLAAVRATTPEVFAALPPNGTNVRELFAVLLGRYGGDPDEAVRGAARACLETLPLTAELITPLLEPAHLSTPLPAAAQTAPSPDPSARSKKKTKKADGDATAAAQAAAATLPPLDPLSLRDAVVALELLQWRGGIAKPGLLAAALQSLLRRQLPVVGSIATVASAEGEGDEEADAAAPLAAADSTDDGAQSSLSGYAVTLALTALASLAEQAGADGDDEEQHVMLASMDIGLAVRAAREAPDAAVRNGALRLLSGLASRMPEAALAHVLQVLAVINASAALQDDEHSRAVGAAALAAVVPAWVAAGQKPAALWDQVAAALPSLPPHRRLDLLLALMRALPEEGLADGLLVLMQHAADPKAQAQAPPTPAVAAAPGAKTPKSAAKMARVGTAAEAQTDAGAEQVAMAGPPPSEWLPELASQLALQVGLSVRLACCARVMELALAASRQQPHTPLPRLVVAFVTAQLKLKVAVAAAGASLRRPEADPVLEAACRRLMEAALAQMQLLQPDAVAADRGSDAASPSGAAGRLNRAVLAASRGLYALFAALQGVMAADTYLHALLSLAEHPSDKVKRRAVKLFTDKVRGVKAEIQDQIELPQRVRDAKVRQASDAAARACGLFPKLLGVEGTGASASPLTRQLALVSLSAIATEFGMQQHATLLAGVPPVLAATKDSHASIRASALAAVASFVRALGSRLVPVLPATVAAAVAAADAAWARLSRASVAAGGSGTGGDVDMEEGAGAAGNGDAAGSSSGAESSDDEDGVEGSGGRRGRSRRSDEDDAALELSSALACLNALVETLGGFLSPHLPSVLSILLNPRVLACRVAGCDKFAAAIRGRLPAAVPPRLLLPALYDRLQPCLDAAADAADASAAAAPAEALMEMVAAAATSMEPKVAAQYHELMFAFLLRALDVRQRRPPPLAAHGDAAIDAVEAAATRALVALVMKLSEARFKPLFLRMLEWASTVSVPEGPGGEPSYLGRMVALFGAVNALIDRLRSVLVPYYRYLLDSCIQHLTGDDGISGSKGRSKKKQRKGIVAAAAGDDAAGGAASSQQETQARLAWLLRLRVVRALHRCFLHDSVGFVDSERFARLQPALVSQLDAEPPASVVAFLLSPSHADPELAAYVSLGKATRAYTAADGAASAGPLGAAAVGCLLALAVAANSDVLWKPLNHAALMLTRSASVRVRALALEVVAQLVDRLREEYLVLLPESLPFVSELLEDVDGAVAARVREVVAQLEEISGEKLDEYLKV